MNVTQAIDTRWSPRAFSNEMIKVETVKELLRAASTAPSCFNEQPWRYIVGFKGDETYQRITECLVEFNQNWTKTAPVLLLGIARKEFARNGNPNPHAWHDLGAASAYLTMKAMEQEIFVHQMAGFSSEKAKESFGISAEFEVVTAIALGKIGDKKKLPADLQEQEEFKRIRNPLNEFAFTTKWKNPL